MRRKGGVGLTRNEERVLVVALSLLQRGSDRFHGYPLAKALADADPRGRVMNYATLYRCLGRLEDRELAASAWTMGETSRPRREYTLTPAGIDEARAVVERSQAAAEVGLGLDLDEMGLGLA